MTARRVDQLFENLIALEGKGYRDYKSVKGRYDFGNFQISIDHVQGDPFAALSKVRIFVDNAVCGFDPWYFANESRTTALCDYLSRTFYAVSETRSKLRGSGHSGKISIDRPGQELVDRTSVMCENSDFEIRFLMGLPADGRRILGSVAHEMFKEDVPHIFNQALLSASLDLDHLRQHAETNEDADFLRNEIKKAGIVSFVANQSFLPRASGVDDRPLDREKGISFQSPLSMQRKFTLPNSGEIEGMAIRKGVTLITGGGYHGKSTLLRAVEVGVYNHIFGDGREFVVTHNDAVKIRAEDGRNVCGVDISAFINNLPNNADTQSFSTNNASGSTSQAANILEALELGASALLIDEDTSATNFMIRDRRMQELVQKNKEPITPLIDRVGSMVEMFDLSIIAVIGGSGDYLDHADQVISMDSYIPFEVTDKAKEVCQNNPSTRLSEIPPLPTPKFNRSVKPESLSARQGRRDVHLRVRECEEILFGATKIDLSQCEQIVHTSQLQAISYALLHLSRSQKNITVQEFCSQIEEKLKSDGLKSLPETPEGNLVIFRRFELASAINRYRLLRIGHTE